MRFSRCLCATQNQKKKDELPSPKPGQLILKTKSYDQTRYRYWLKIIRDCVEADTYLDGSPRKPEDRVKS